MSKIKNGLLFTIIFSIMGCTEPTVKEKVMVEKMLYVMDLQASTKKQIKVSEPIVFTVGVLGRLSNGERTLATYLNEKQKDEMVWTVYLSDYKNDYPTKNRYIVKKEDISEDGLSMRLNLKNNIYKYAYVECSIGKDGDTESLNLEVKRDLSVDEIVTGYEPSRRDEIELILLFNTMYDPTQEEQEDIRWIVDGEEKSDLDGKNRFYHPRDKGHIYEAYLIGKKDEVVKSEDKVLPYTGTIILVPAIN